MADEVGLLSIMSSWIKDKFPEITVTPDDHFPNDMIRLNINPLRAGNNYTGLIGAVQVDEVMLWDDGEFKMAGGRYIFYDPRDPKFFHQVFEHLVRIVQNSQR